MFVVYITRLISVGYWKNVVKASQFTCQLLTMWRYFSPPWPKRPQAPPPGFGREIDNFFKNFSKSFQIDNIFTSAKGILRA